MQKAPWSTAVAAAALLALPVAAFAQSTESAPPQNPPAQQSQPPAATPPSSTSTPPQLDANAAKTHLSEARDTLSQLTSLPEAAKLQGESRNQVSQLISNFNALITTQSDWHAAYGKVNENLTALLGADAPDQPVGTSGSATTVEIDPAVRAKLVEFRTHLKAFEKAAGGGAMAPSAPTPTTSNPSNPASASNPANPSNSSAAVTPASPTANMDPSDRSKAASAVAAAPNADAQKELDAISSILSASKTGALTSTQTAEIKKHVEALRVLLTRQ